MSQRWPLHACPKCRSGEIDRVARDRIRDRIAGLFGWRVYRCRECRVRFYDRPSARKVS